MFKPVKVVHRKEELPEGTICTQRLHNLIHFNEYKGFLTKCRIYMENRNMDITDYVDGPGSLIKHSTKVYFLPIDLAIGIIENVRMSNPNRGATLKYLYTLRGEKIHIQLHERKAEEFVRIIGTVLKGFGIESVKEYHCDNYFIDLYIPELRIAVEYDEKHHTYGKDIGREIYLKEKLGCSFIRIKDETDIATSLTEVLTKVLQ